MSSRPALALLVVAVVVMTIQAADEPALRFIPNRKLRPFPNPPSVDSSLFGTIYGAAVDISYGYKAGFDTLEFDYRGLAGIEGMFDPETGVLWLYGEAPVTEYATALSSVWFSTSSSDGYPRTITWNFGDSTLYIPDTGHFYKLVYPENPVTWTSAKSFCTTESFFGMTGYLATITDENENNELAAKINLGWDMWIGASDRAPDSCADCPDGVWAWVTGPEGKENGGKGRNFWLGASRYSGGRSVNDTFTSWKSFQPNNENGDEHYGALTHGTTIDIGYWVDLAENAVVHGYICEFGGEGTQYDTQERLEQLEGSRNLLPGCSDYVTKGDCAAASKIGCFWDAGLNVCQLGGCLKADSEDSCVADKKCMWDESAHPPFCVKTACAQFVDWNTCATDPTCTWNGGVCVPAMCSDKNTSCACHLTKECFWSVDTTYSNRLCINSEYSDCNAMDMIFVVDESASMAGVFGVHKDGYYSLLKQLGHYVKAVKTTMTAAGVAAPADRKGMRFGFVSFSDGAVVGKATQGRLSGVPQEVLADLDFLMSPSARRKGASAVAPALSQVKAMIDPNRKTGVFIITDDKFSDDVATLQTMAAGLKAPNTFLFGIALKRHEGRQLPDLAAEAALRTILGDSDRILPLLLDDVERRILAGACDSTMVVGKYLSPAKVGSSRCADKSTKSVCNAEPRCVWNFAVESCEDSHCTLACDPTTCAKDPLCHWDAPNNECEGTSCSTLTTQPACTKAAACQWTGTTCDQRKCVEAVSEESCEADPDGCQWDESVYPHCSDKLCDYKGTTAEADCSNDVVSNCRYSREFGCRVDHCQIKVSPTLYVPKYSTEAACVNGSRACAWIDGMCQEHDCAQRNTEKTCNARAMCYWDNRLPNVCGLRLPCGAYSTISVTADKIARCNADAECAWKPDPDGVMMCLKEGCSDQTTSCSCLAKPGCLWREKACVDQRFALCPKIDLVLAFEGSAIMDMPFGRHPSGWDGMLTVVKSWVDTAPLSSSVGQPGFRVALYQYGGEGSIEYDNGPGGKDGLTGDRSALRKQVEYQSTSMKSWSKTFINPVFLQASNLFKDPANANNGRQKVVIVIGNQPLKDDGTKLRVPVREMQAAGVRIFGHVLQRFDTISTNEKATLSALKDLVTDPKTLHARVNTLDNLQQLLFDKICDPTSNYGASLQVNRDGDISCGWFSNPTECAMENNCEWAATKPRTCASADQCPNLDCTTLSSGLVKAGFNCSSCYMDESQAVHCSPTRNDPPLLGACVLNTCGSKCEATCTADQTNCDWNAQTQRCNAKKCNSFGEKDCLSQPMCTWASGACRDSRCSDYRSVQSCVSARDISPEGDVYQICSFNSSITPAVCVEKTCELRGSQDSCAQSAWGECTYIPFFKPSCTQKLCDYTDATKCNADIQCYWHALSQVQIGNTFVSQPACLPRSSEGNCVLSDYSQWSACSAPCGEGSVQTKVRTVIMNAQGRGKSCDAVAADGCNTNPVDGGLVGPNCETGDNARVMVKTCQVPACSLYCKNFKTTSTCMEQRSCFWEGGECTTRDLHGCGSLLEAECKNYPDQCRWTGKVCEDIMQQCIAPTATECARQANCAWIASGLSADDSAAYNDYVRTAKKYPNTRTVSNAVYQPGSAGTAAFPNVIIPAYTLPAGKGVMGVTILISDNYQRGKDRLILRAGGNTVSSWNEAEGALYIDSSMEQQLPFWEQIVRSVFFYSTSTKNVTRIITWNLGKHVFYNWRNHHLYYFSQGQMKWSEAKTNCTRKSLFSMPGYLATITSQAEYSLLTARMEAHGWLGASDLDANGKSSSDWKWVNGPEDGQTFWTGEGKLKGGQPAGDGLFNAWAPPSTINCGGEPNNRPGEDYLMMTFSGDWEDVRGDDPRVQGFTCEFGTGRNDPDTGNVDPTDGGRGFPVGGVSRMAVAGCVPPVCSWIKAQRACDVDPECHWSSTKNACVPACETYASKYECTNAKIGDSASTSKCRWNVDRVPSMCELDECSILGTSPCKMDPRCEWVDQDTICRYKTGCDRFDKRQAGCQEVEGCVYNPADGKCTLGGCSTKQDPTACSNEPTCWWTGSKCDVRKCAFCTSSGCASDPSCRWEGSEFGSANIVPNQQNFAPGGVSRVFSNYPNLPYGRETWNGFTVIITEGYTEGDSLSYEPSIKTSAVVGLHPSVLVVIASPELTAKEIANLIQTVSFKSTDPSLRNRKIVYAFGANAIPFPIGEQTAAGSMTEPARILQARTSDTFITWQAAADACANSRDYWKGSLQLTGYLATVRSENENSMLTRIAAEGWLGATSTRSVPADKIVDKTTAFGFSWVTGDSNTLFWQGGAKFGLPVNQMYSKFAPGQPVTADKSASYALYLKSSGSSQSEAGRWYAENPSNASMKRRYFCEYGKTGESFTFSGNYAGYTLLVPQGCFAKDCESKTDISSCLATQSCQWFAGRCAKDATCSQYQNPDLCSTRGKNCFWDFTKGCIQAARNPCMKWLTQEVCEPGCKWNAASQSCTLPGCAPFPKDACNGQPTCTWDKNSESCIPRLCGGTTLATCVKDDQCRWTTEGLCTVTPCGNVDSQASCTAADTRCAWLATESRCYWKACSYNTPFECNADERCTWPAGAGSCLFPDCGSALSAEDCRKKAPHCNLDPSTAKCVVSSCSRATQSECGSNDPYDPFFACKSSGSACTPMSETERSAAVTKALACVPGTEPDLANPWFWILLALILLALILIGATLWRAYKNGYQFFDPSRYTKDFSHIYKENALDLAANSNTRAVNEEEANLMDGGHEMDAAEGVPVDGTYDAPDIYDGATAEDAGADATGDVGPVDDNDL